MLFKKISIFFSICSFLFLTLFSTQSFSGGDPDDFAHEEEQVSQTQDLTDHEEKVTQNKPEINIQQNISFMKGGCTSFPEAIAYKEHFACLADIEKNRIARINWSFSKLLLR